MTAEHFVSETCEGEVCLCGAPATHKVEESIAPDDPKPVRHPLVRYLCCTHFANLMGSQAPCMTGDFQ